MVSPFSETIDFDEIEKQGLKAIERDARYWRENDAKFRAVNQKVASYEEFRDIVLASHLKPLDKGDKIEFDPAAAKRGSRWNVLASKKDGLLVQGNSDISESLLKPNGKIEEFPVPQSVAEFTKFWRNLDSSMTRWIYLQSLEPKYIGELFTTEIPAGILLEIITVLNSVFSEINSDNVLQVIDILKQISQSKRFSLSVMFLSSEEKTHVRQLFNFLKSAVSDEAGTNNLLQLAKVYSV